MDLYRRCYDHQEVCRKINWANDVLSYCRPIYIELFHAEVELNEEDAQFIRVFELMNKNLHECQWWIRYHGMRATNERYLIWLARYFLNQPNKELLLQSKEGSLWYQIQQYFKLDQSCLS